MDPSQNFLSHVPKFTISQNYACGGRFATLCENERFALFSKRVSLGMSVGLALQKMLLKGRSALTASILIFLTASSKSA